MNTIRFTLLAIGLFTLTFAGISWASSRAAEPRGAHLKDRAERD
jgi:hypothetical protein